MRSMQHRTVFFFLTAFCLLQPACFLAHQNHGAPKESAAEDGALIDAGRIVDAGRSVDSAFQDTAVQETAVRESTAPDAAMESAIDAAVADAAVRDAYTSEAATALAERLVGHWMAAGYMGDCINEEIWFSFESPDRATYQYLDNSFCYDVWISESRSGRFVIENRRDLVFRWNEFAWHSPPQNFAYQIEQRYPVAISENREGVPRLHTYVFTRIDDRRWRYSYLELGTTEQGLPLFKDEVVMDLRFDRPLPTSGNGTIETTVSVALSQIDRDAGLDNEYSAELYVVPCVYQPKPESGFIYIEFEGYHYSDQGWAEWNEFLEAQGYEQQHPDWVRERLDGHLFVMYYLDPAEPDFLFRQHSSWDYYRSPTPPPEPAPEP